MDWSGIQSILHAARGSAAALTHELGLVLYLGAAAIFLVVLALAIHAVRAPAARETSLRWVVLGGLALPVAALSALLLYALAVGGAISTHAPPDALRIHVTGRQWWWDVRYELPGRSDLVPLANELYIPLDRPVELLLTTQDVIHSFWVPALAGKVDMIPGRTTRLVLRSRAPGVFRGQCAEYCGGQHALMALYVVAQTEAEFRAWIERQARPAATPQDPFLARGRDAFLRGECPECHTVRGTTARSTRGPDLTHVGSRRSLGAGMLHNHVGTMAGWIAGSQDLKPGNLMPSSKAYSGQELRALSAWLESLE